MFIASFQEGEESVSEKSVASATIARGWGFRAGPNRLSWCRRSHSSPKSQIDFSNKRCTGTGNGNSGFNLAEGEARCQIDFRW